jgi:hypothetical protein
VPIASDSNLTIFPEESLPSNDGFAVLHPDRPWLLGNGRYAMRPDWIAPLWGIAFDPTRPDATPRFVTDRSLPAEDREALWALLWGVAPEERSDTRRSERMPSAAPLPTSPAP